MRRQAMRGRRISTIVKPPSTWPAHEPFKRSLLTQRPAGSRECLPGASTGALVLSDGTVFEGTAFGANKAATGQVVFSTNMMAYPESMTDPSFCGQILTFTYPLVGNYGTPSPVLDKWGLATNYESDRIWVNGILVGDYSDSNYHWAARRTLHEWMLESGVPGLAGVDTRALTKKIRADASLLGRFELPGANVGAHGAAFDLQPLRASDRQPLHAPPPFRDPNEENLVARVSTSEVKEYGPADADVRVVVVDMGVKANILRALCERGVRLSVVPHDYDYVAAGLQHDGVFVSNGPGDPRMCGATVGVLQKAMAARTPIFGICMGNQILGLAAGATISKMPFGNRGHNQPVVNELNGKAYVTSQNHGFAVDPSSLAADGWRPYFRNLNDGSNEGLIHETLPWSSVQFHPEARGGPHDTLFLFDRFVAQCRQHAHGRPVANFCRHPELETPRKVLVLGSGGLMIGQAGEFDYSGSQALKAYKGMGVETVLINPNIATIQTSQGLADAVYYMPVTERFVEEVIAKERPDAISLSFGGQTALNVGVALHRSGALARHGVRVLGTSVRWAAGFKCGRPSLTTASRLAFLAR